MKDFWKKANKYVKDNIDSATEKVKNFTYGNSEIDIELLTELIKIKDELDYYYEAYDRESDYIRLLRLESSDLKAELEYIKDMLEDNPPKIIFDGTGEETAS